MLRIIYSAFIFTALFLFVGNSPEQNVFAADGDLDLSFHGTGYVDYFRSVTVSNTSYLGPATSVQPDGKIIVAYDGLTSIGGISNDAFITNRYNADGSLDATFGTGGTVKNSFGLWETLRQVLLQPDGKILLIGARFPNGNSDHDFAVVRYHANGTLDTSFNGTGVTTININGASRDYAYSAVLQPDGKIVLAGLTDSSENFNSHDLALVRINANGSLDGSFGGNGKVVVTLQNFSESINSAALQPDGKIVVTGTFADSSGYQMFVLRLTADGLFDETFRNGGLFSPGLGRSSSQSILIQPDGKILIGGWASDGANSEFALLRFLGDGSADASFDGDGVVLTAFPPSSSASASSLVLQSNGKITAAGGAGGMFAIARYNPNGSLDTSFSGDGKTTGAFRAGIRATSAALQPDGKLIIAGETNTSSLNGNWVIAARYQLSETNAARTAFDFDGDAKADVSVFRPNGEAWHLLRTAAGYTGFGFGLTTDKIVPADYDADGKTDVAVFRDGSWYLINSLTNQFQAVSFGQAGDIPVPADYDADGRADFAVYRPSNSTWYLLRSTAGFAAVQFGAAGDNPVAADYDGDSKADVAVFRSLNGTWYSLRSTEGFTAVGFGADGDRAVPADYDGDGKVDVAVFRPSNGSWYLLRSGAGFTGFGFGISTDIPVPADYDGDGKTDVAVFRNGNWYLINSASNQFQAIGFGTTGDKPVPASFVP